MRRYRVRLDFVLQVTDEDDRGLEMNPTLNDAFEAAVKALWPKMMGGAIESNGHFSLTRLKVRP